MIDTTEQLEELQKLIEFLTRLEKLAKDRLNSAPPEPLEPEPCFFCGWQPGIGERGYEFYFVFCRNSYCGAEGPTLNTKEKAIDSWNEIAKAVRCYREHNI
jgi:hypothetical protein